MIRTSGQYNYTQGKQYFGQMNATFIFLAALVCN